jgi:hypothetical protein
MAVIHVHSIDAETGAEVRGSRLRAGSAQAAVDHALQLNVQYSAPQHATKIHYSGDFVDPAFADLTQLAQQHGLEFEVGGA